MNRRNRGRFFAKQMVAEFAWDFLLALYITEAAQPRQTILRLAHMTGAPEGPAGRWIDLLEAEKLIVRFRRPCGGAADELALTDLGRSTLDRFLTHALSKAGPR